MSCKSSGYPPPFPRAHQHAAGFRRKGAGIGVPQQERGHAAVVLLLGLLLEAALPGSRSAHLPASQVLQHARVGGKGLACAGWCWGRETGRRCIHVEQERPSCSGGSPVGQGWASMHDGLSTAHPDRHVAGAVPGHGHAPVGGDCDAARCRVVGRWWVGG